MPPRIAALAPWLVAALFAGLGVVTVSRSLLNDDTAWYIHMASVWLDGGRLYRDVIDTNPPLIVFLTALPVEASRLLHAPETVAVKAFVFALVALSVGVAAQGIWRTWTSWWDRLLILSVLTFSILPLVGPDFGQREHFAVILIAPYVFGSCAWMAGRPLRRSADWAAAIAAGLGFAIKPYFLAAWLALEVCLLVSNRSARSLWRPGAVVVIAIQLLYAALIVILVPDYLSVARDALQVYGALNVPPSVLVGLVDLRVWLLALTAAAVRTEPRLHGPRLLLLATATGFLVGAVVQSKAWPYQLYPFRVFAFLFFAAWFPALLDSYPALRRVIGGARLVPAAALALLVAWSGREAVRSTRPGGFVESFIELVERQPRHESFALLSMRNIVWPAFPVATYTRSAWVLRHNSLWFMPGLYDEDAVPAGGHVAFHPLAAMPPLERRYFDEIVDDLCRQPPRLLVIQPPLRDAPAGDRSIDLQGYYLQDVRFARLFAGYSETATIGTFTVFTRDRDLACE